MKRHCAGNGGTRIYEGTLNEIALRLKHMHSGAEMHKRNGTVKRVIVFLSLSNSEMNADSSSNRLKTSIGNGKGGILVALNCIAHVHRASQRVCYVVHWENR